MNLSFAVLGPVLIAIGLGVAAIVFGQVDDAPGLVMFGLLAVVGAIAVTVSPALRSRSRVVGLVLGAIAVTIVGVLTAGWLENNF